MPTRDQIVTAGVVGFIIFAVVTASILYYISRLPSYGNIKAIGIQVYGDSALTKPVESVNWGTIDAGSYSIANLWIRNNGTAPANLTLTTQNYNPAVAKTYLTLTWSYAGQTVQPNGVIAVSLQLSVSPQVKDVTAFSFDIIMTASG
jgi:hypothetical protein